VAVVLTDDLDMMVLDFQHLIEPQQTEDRDGVYSLHHLPLERPALVGNITRFPVFRVPVLDLRFVINAIKFVELDQIFLCNRADAGRDLSSLYLPLV